MVLVTRKKKYKKPIAVALVAIVIIIVTVTSYLFFKAEEGVPSYSIGDRWTWQVTREELDPLTDNITSTRTYEQTIEYVGEGTRDGYDVGIFELTTSDQSAQHARILQVIQGGEVRELASESFADNLKLSEYLYSAPILIRKFPLKIGLRFSDVKEISGYDNAAGIESIDALETRVTEVVAKETLLMPAKIDTYKLRSWGTSTGTMRMAGSTSTIIVTYKENLWYSPEVKEVVKSVSETTTVVVTSYATSVTKTREERVLTSYSIG